VRIFAIRSVVRSAERRQLFLHVSPRAESSCSPSSIVCITHHPMDGASDDNGQRILKDRLRALGAGFIASQCSRGLNFLAAPGARVPRWRMDRISLAAVLTFVWGGCLYDADSRCDRGQVLSADGYCICAEGAVLEGGRCIVCGDGYRVVSGHCECERGLVAQGDSCVAVEDDDAGATSAPAAAPSGQGAACTADGGECLGFEADYCESVLLQQCLVQGCSLSGEDCGDGWICCDVALAGVTLCLEEARLEQELGSVTCPSF